MLVTQHAYFNQSSRSAVYNVKIIGLIIPPWGTPDIRIAAFLDFLMSPPFWQFHRNIEIKVINNHHFVFVCLLWKLDYSLYGKQNDSI